MSTTIQYSRIIDLSHPLGTNTDVFPGDLPVEVAEVDSTANSSDDGRRHLNCTRLTLTVHTGTHMDAPFHFFATGIPIDQVPLQTCIGPATLVRVQVSESSSVVETADIEPYMGSILKTRRVLLDTGTYKSWGSPAYFSNHPVISGACAKRLVGAGVVMIGVDTPSVDRPPFDAHLAILGSGLVIVENLTNLGAIPDGTEPNIAILPLRISGRDGSPVRAIAFV